MKLPRNIDGDELARLLNRHGYRIDHQTVVTSVYPESFPAKFIT